MCDCEPVLSVSAPTAPQLLLEPRACALTRGSAPAGGGPLRPRTAAVPLSHWRPARKNSGRVARGLCKQMRTYEIACHLFSCNQNMDNKRRRWGGRRGCYRVTVWNACWEMFSFVSKVIVTNHCWFGPHGCFYYEIYFVGQAEGQIIPTGGASGIKRMKSYNQKCSLLL